MSGQSDQSEQYRFFYLDRKLSATNPLEILQALQSAQTFIGDVTKIELLNNVIIRLMGILKNTDKLFIKQKICLIISFYVNKIKSTPNIQIVTKYFTKGVRTQNTLTRIIILKTLSEIIKASTLLHKQTSLYHNLLSKLEKNTSKDFEIRNQRKFAYKCLKNLLANSSFIATCFAKNIEVIYRYGNISSCTLLSLCLFGDFKPEQFQMVLSKAKIIIQQRPIEKNKAILQQLIVKFLSINYHLFIQSSEKYFPFLSEGMQRWAKKSLNSKYSFIKKVKKLEVQTQSFEQYLDYLYILKNQGQSCLFDQYSLQHMINNQSKSYKNLQHLVLALYYSQNKQCQKIVLPLIQQIIKSMTNFDERYWLRLLKISLVSATNNLSVLIVDLLLKNISQIQMIDKLMWIKMFLGISSFIENNQFEQLSELLPTFQSFTYFLFPNADFKSLPNYWKNIYLNKQAIQKNSQNIEVDNRSQCQQIVCMMKITKYLKCKNQNQFTKFWLADISKMMPGFKIFELKNKNMLAFVFLTKQTVLKIFQRSSL